MHKSVCQSTGCAIVNKIKLLFIYVIFCFNWQTIASSTVRIACPKLRIYELRDRWIATFKPRIYELTDRRSVCDKAYFDLKNFSPLRINPWTFSFKSFPFHLPNPQHSVSHQAHPLLPKSCGQPSSPPVSSHIPSSGGAWGGRSFCQFLSFLLSHLRPFAL